MSQSKLHNIDYVSLEGARRLVLALVAGLTAVRLVTAALAGLGDVEAYYWTWSQNLALGYLDHGPLVAWLIRLGRWIAGETALAVRLPFVLISAATLLLVDHLARRLAPDCARGGLWSVLLVMAMPMFFVAGAAANPDVPYMLLVLLFVWALLRLQESPPAHRARWVVIGALLGGAACCAKFFGVLLAVPLLAATWRFTRRPALLALASGVMILGSAPVLWWNATSGWPSLLYHFGARHTQPIGPSVDNVAKLLGGQLGYVQPLVLVALGAVAVQLWRRRASATAWLLLLCAAPLLVGGTLLILLVPGAEPHWPAAGYLPLAIAAGPALVGWRGRSLTRRLCTVGLALSLIAACAIHVHVLTDLGVRLMPAGYVPRYDLSNELVGWPRVASAVDDAVAKRGQRPTVAAACHYTSCSQLAFAARGRFEVLCPSPRLDQFDLQPGGDGSARRGVDLLYVRDERFPFEADQIYRCRTTRAVERILIRRAGRVVRRFELQRCVAFAGLRAQTWPPP